MDSDLRGHSSHGVHLLPYYLSLFRTGKRVARPAIAVTKRGPGAAVVDGGLGMGQLGARVGMQTAIELARETGVAAVNVTRSGHYGAGAYWVQLAADADMIGFTTCNEGAMTVAAHGGGVASMGNLPFAWAIPAGEHPDVVLDMAVGTVASGQVHVAKLLGKAIPLGWAIDGAGNSTTDPGAVRAILPFGGAKGYAIAVLCDILSGILGGSDSSPVKWAAASESEGWSNHFFLAIDIQRFTPLSEFKAAVDRHVRVLKEAHPAPGVERVRLPGERSWENRQLRQVEGIPMPVQILADLAKEGAAIGVRSAWVQQWAARES